MNEDKNIQDPAMRKIEGELAKLGRTLKAPTSLISKTKTALFQKIDRKQSVMPKNLLSGFFDKFMKKGLQVAFSALLILITATMYLLIGIQPSEAAFIGQLNVSEGKAFVLRAAQIIEVTSHEKLFVGDSVEVPKDTKAEIHFIDHTKTALSSETNVTIKKFESNSNSGKDYVKKIALSKGEVKETTTTTLASNVQTGTTIETPTGVVEAAPNASFIVSVDDKKNLASVIVTEKQVAVKDLSPTNSDVAGTVSDNKELPVALISQGETATLHLDNGAGSTKVQVDGVSLIADTADKPIAKKTENANSNTNINSERSKERLTKSDELVAVPQSAEINLAETKAIDDIIASADIAQVKLLHVLEIVEGEQHDAELLMAIRAYYQTLNSIGIDMDIISPTNSFSGVHTINKPSDFMTTSSLTALVSSYAATRNVVEKSNLPRFEVALGKLTKLQTIESSIAIKIRLQSLKDDGTSYSNKATNSSISNLQSLKSDLPFEQKRAIAAVIDTELTSKVDAVSQVKDVSERARQFVEYLDTIPDTKANYTLLDNLYKRSPTELKGYVKLKMHRIMYAS